MLVSSSLGIQNRLQSNQWMLCPCCGAEIRLGVAKCGCGARFVGAPLDETPIKVKRFGPAMTAILALAVSVAAALVITKWLAVTVLIAIRYAMRALRLTRREPEWYGGLRVTVATLILAITAGAIAATYGIANIPTFLDNRRVRRIAATQASMYHLANLLEDYKRAYGSYPQNTQEIRKAVTESLPVDYWQKTIRYQSFAEDIADGSMNRIGIHFNNFELRSAGPDGKEGTDDDIIMRDGVFYANSAVKKLPATHTSSDR